MKDVGVSLNHPGKTCDCPRNSDPAAMNNDKRKRRKCELKRAERCRLYIERLRPFIRPLIES